MAKLYDDGRTSISRHLKRIFERVEEECAECSIDYDKIIFCLKKQIKNIAKIN